MVALFEECKAFAKAFPIKPVIAIESTTPVCSHCFFGCDTLCRMIMHTTDNPLSVHCRHEIICHYPVAMPRMNSHVIAELMPLECGSWGLGLLHSGLSQGEACDMAANLPSRPGVVLLVGSSWTHTTHLYAPYSPDITHNEQGSYRRRLQMWIDWLRGLGIIRLGVLAENGEVQVIPAVFARGMTSINPLLTTMEWLEADTRYLSVGEIEALIESAPATSIAGLMRGHALVNDFAHWLKGLSQENGLYLQLPLYQKTPPLLLEGALIEVNLWVDAAKLTWPVIGHLTQIRIDKDERIMVQDYPIDRFGLTWSQAGDRSGVMQLDRVYSSTQDRHLDEAFDRLPQTVSWVISQTVLKVFDHNQEELPVKSDDASEVKRWVDIVIEAMQPEVDVIRREVLDFIYPYDGQSRSPSVVRYLIAPKEKQLRLRRIQALNAFPAATIAIVSELLPKTCAAIDASRPLLKALADEMKVPLWVVRRACKLPCRDVDWSDRRAPTLEELFGTIEALGPKCPLCDADMLRNLVDMRREFYGLRENAEEEDLIPRRLLAAIGRSAEIGGWESTTASFNRLSNFETLHTIEDYWHLAVGTVIDALLPFRRQLPGHGLVKLINRIIDVWLSKQSAQELIERSERWQRLKWNLSQNAVEVKLKEKILDVPIAPLFEPLRWSNTGVDIEVLTSKERLNTESNFMRHCVASYWIAVATKRVLVVSLLESVSGLRATLALNVNSMGEWRIREFKGVANVAIAEDSLLAKTATDLIYWMSEPAPEIDKTELQLYLDRSVMLGPMVNGYQINVSSIQGLPEADQELAAACFPGAGPINKRIVRILMQLGIVETPLMSASGPESEWSRLGDFS